VCFTAHRPGLIWADLMHEQRDHQPARLVAVQGCAKDQVADTAKRSAHGSVNGGLQQRAVLMFEAGAQPFGKQSGRARRDAYVALGSQALHLEAHLTRCVRRECEVAEAAILRGGHRATGPSEPRCRTAGTVGAEFVASPVCGALILLTRRAV